MHFVPRFHRFHGVLKITLALVIFFAMAARTFAQGPQMVDISVSVTIPTPVISAVGGSDSLSVAWNWDYLSVGYFPPSISEVRVEISTDGLNYGNLHVQDPDDFVSLYTTLPAQIYTAQLTFVSATDFDYVVGPVLVGTSGGGRRTDPPSDPTPTPPEVTVDGLGYGAPGSQIIFTIDGGFQLTLDPDDDGQFSSTLTTISSGVHTFTFSAQDPDGVLSAPVSFDYDVLSGVPQTVDNIHLPPTLSISDSVLAVGETITISGYAYPDGEVTININGQSSSAFLVQVDSDGRWTLEVDTSNFGAGTYEVVAFAVNAAGTIVSPDSLTEVFELVAPLTAPPVCGNALVESPDEACDDGNRANNDGCDFFCQIEPGYLAICGNSAVEAGESCDDGNILAGDGCSAICQAEAFPETTVMPPPLPVVTSEELTLAYQVVSAPNGPVVSVRVFYSLDGASYQSFPGVFSSESITLTDLNDGVYRVYSVGTDSIGVVEGAPAVHDVEFTVDTHIDFQVLAKPEKRIPAQGNWGHAGHLELLIPGASASSYEWDINLNNVGNWRQDATEMEPGVYTVTHKGQSHLSRKLEAVDFNPINNVLVDFTLSGLQFLLAGDVHVTKDDYINGLDISALVIQLYGPEVNADLNADGLVNSLDISVLIVNLYKRGEA